MPLRDHFHPPLDNVLSWEEFHGMWPATIVQQVRPLLPPGYAVAPRAHLGSYVEIDIATFERDDAPPASEPSPGDAAAAAWAAALPIVSVETEPPDYAEYEVRVYDARKGRTLVAAIEIVSPANKDRPESRNAFVGKCAALLQQGIAVSIVDLVTTRRFNLFAELMAFVGQGERAAPPLYATSARWVRRGQKAVLDTVVRPLAVGEPLPTLPLWLPEGRVVPLDLEASYEQACADLAIT